MRRIEVWGGVECTVNRVGDVYLDQLELSGHRGRLDDLDRLASLGIAALRYPVIWEITAPDGADRADFHFADERLGRLRQLGVDPIVTLVHHGSGPRHTSIVDESFVDGLSAFARAVAERYPWVKRWTPVNEPLTTARFSTLYGHWYPHQRDEGTFFRATLTECLAIARAMEQIRAVIPDAELIQTEDVAHVFSTDHLRYQAEYENERRWLSLDLLTGRVVPGHWFFQRMLNAGVEERALRAMSERPCAPDVVGLNYYMTSDRLLDERVDRYPPHLHGGNGREAYADVEAVRVLPDGVVGHRRSLLEAWERYRLPVAITELHLGCTRDEQLRWMDEAWKGAHEAADEGADVRAITVWSLFGAFGWDTLVTRAGRYEPGAFDVRGGTPRPTAIAWATRDLATKGEIAHPAVVGVPWWRRPERLQFPRDGGEIDGPMSASPRGRPILIVGAGGTLGRGFVAACELRGLHAVGRKRGELDVTDRAALARALDELRPWAVVNAAGYVRVDDAEHEPGRCFRVNAEAAALLAEECCARDLPLLTYSTDLVFDGAQRRPYRESDGVRPLSVYGRSKVEAERRVSEICSRALIIRTSAFFGPDDQANFVTIALRALAAGESFRAAADAVVSPTYVPDLVHASLDLLIDGAHGTFHLANAGETTWAKLAARAAQLADVSTRALVAVPTAQLGLRAARPLYSALGSARGASLPELEDALARYLRERAA
ncbi:MAG: sugar nucleotide-binding protein [Deltaproteobacteria bacterium]|nr:sugar nucleotide-binding protein [Deltaproteobacteria bacterium]